MIGGDEKNIDPDDPANKGKITEWEAGWNVTNAIQVSCVREMFSRIPNLQIYYFFVKKNSFKVASKCLFCENEYVVIDTFF